MKLINSPLTKWSSNLEQFKAIWRAEGQDTEVQTEVLGVSWNTETDCFSFGMDAITKKLPEGPTAKRQLLQTTARFYDPLGLYSYSRTPGVGGLIGMSSCLLTLEHSGMLGYPP